MTSLHESESDLPLAGLPSAGRTVLRSASVEVAIAEVRFASTGDAVSTEQMLQIKELAEDQGVLFASVQPAEQQELMVQLGTAGASPQVQVRARGWQLAQDGGQLLATVMPDSLVVQTSDYERWSLSLRPALEALLSGVQQVLKPELRHRLGLRYVNRLIDSESRSPLAWRERISPPFLGPVLDSVIGGKVTATQQQVQLSFAAAQGALIRHGAFRDGAAQNATSYLLDIDVFDASSMRFDSSVTLEMFQRLNRTALSLFRQAVSEEYWKAIADVSAGPAQND